MSTRYLSEASKDMTNLEVRQIVYDTVSLATTPYSDNHKKSAA